MIFRKEIGESLTLKFGEAVAERRRRNLPVVSLGLGEPDFETPIEIIDSTVEALRKGNSRYSSPLGLLSLREKIAVKLNEENGIHCSAENLIITAGAKQAFQLISMALLEPGDEVIIVNPSFVSFIPQLCISETRCKIVEVNVSKDDFSLPIHEISEKVTSKTKLLVINTPNNPAGYMLKESELIDLYAIAENRDFHIVSDEVYEKILFGNRSHFSIGSQEDHVKRVITINGFSKSHAMTGWRLGYACFPIELKSKLLKLQQHMNTNTCTFIQEGLNNAFLNCNDHHESYNRKLAGRLKIYNEMVSNLRGVSGVIPEGGFFAFLNISGLGIDSNSFCGRLIKETGVATTPGIAFGKAWDDHVRISFATDDDELSRGLGLMKDFIQNFN